MGTVTTADANLREEVKKAAGTLHLMNRHQEILGAEISNEIQGTVKEVQRRLERKDLAVVVVGEKKAGKSTFLNAILGTRVLGTAVRECTGTVTFIRRAPRPSYRAQLRNGRAEEFKDLEAEERDQRRIEIEALRKRLGGTPERQQGRDHRSGSAEAQARAEAGWDAAKRRFEALEEAIPQWKNRKHKAVDDLGSLNQERVIEEANLARMEDTSRAARRRLADLERVLSDRLTQAQDHVRSQGLADPGAITPRSEAFEIFQTAEANRARAQASVPGLLRSGPWWAFWIPVLKTLFGWKFKASMKAAAVAQAEMKQAALMLAASEAADRVAYDRKTLAGLEGQRQEGKGHLDALLNNVTELETRLKETTVALANLESNLPQARREADLAMLELHWVKADALEERFLSRYHAEVHALTDMEKRGPEVVELSIGYPAVHLPDGITIIDTPGVNTDNETNRELAWNVIRREADGCLLISDLQQVVSRSTRDFLQDLRGVIPHILLVMSKVDRALANAEDIGDIEPWQQVEEARRAGVRRFAKEVGREPGEVFSIAVAAEPALRRDEVSDAARGRFSQEVTKLFDLLKAERAIVLGARSATALRYCVQRIGEAETRAESAYSKRISDLEKHRLPDPAQFQARQIARIGDELQTHSEAIAKLAVDQMVAGVDAVQRGWLSRIQAGTSKDEVKGIIAQLGEQGQRDLGGVVNQVQSAVGRASGQAIRDLEAPLLEELSERYRIVQGMKGSGKAVRLEGVGSSTADAHAVNIQAGVSKAVSDFEADQFTFGAGGAAAGAAIGTLFFPGIGTVVGAAIGALAGFFKTLDSLKADCSREVCKGMDSAKENLGSQLASVGPGVEKSLRKVLGKCLSDEVVRFQSWINKVMEEERREIEKERQKLSDLIQIKGKLLEHDSSLTRFQREAAAVSQGLCS